MDYMPEYDGPNPHMYDKLPCACGSIEVKGIMHIKKGTPKFRVYCCKCDKCTRPYLRLIDAVHKWNEMNEREDAK